MNAVRLLTLPQPFASALIDGRRLTHCTDLRRLPDLRADLHDLEGRTFVVRAADVNWGSLPLARKHLDLPAADELPVRVALGTVVFERLEATSDSPWWKPGQHALVFRDPVALPAPLAWQEHWSRHWGSLLLHLRPAIAAGVAHALGGRA